MTSMLTTNLLPGDYDGVFGSYLFENLLGGTYAVRVLDDNFNPGAVLENTIPTYDLDGHIPTPNIASLTLAVGEERLDVDFGYQGNDAGELGSVGDLVWFDINGDGIQNPGELGIPGVFVWLDQNGNGVWDPTEAFAITDANGFYLIEGLVGGDYTLMVDSSTLPDGAVATYALDPDFDPDDPNSWHVSNFTLAAKEDRQDIDFGYRGTTSLGDLVWRDQNGNGIQDPGENGIPNVSVRLYWDANGNGVLDNDERANPLWSSGTSVPLGFTVTDENGNYQFDHLFGGTYFVEVVPSTLPVYHQPTHDYDDPAPGVFTGAGPANTPHFATVTLDGVESVFDVDFGYRFVPPVSPVADAPESVSSIIPGFPDDMVSTYFMTMLQPRFENWALQTWEMIDFTPIFSSPIISGHAEPGSKIVLTLYNHRGEMITANTVLVGVGGNWTTHFSDVEIDGPITIVSTVNSSDFSALNSETSFNFRTNYVTGLPGGYFQSQGSYSEHPFAQLSYSRFESMSAHHSSSESEDAWLKNDFEFLAKPGLPAN